MFRRLAGLWARPNHGVVFHDSGALGDSRGRIFMLVNGRSVAVFPDTTHDSLEVPHRADLSSSKHWLDARCLEKEISLVVC